MQSKKPSVGGVGIFSGTVHSLEWTNHYPLANIVGFVNSCQLDRDLSSGWHYPLFLQPGPGWVCCVSLVNQGNQGVMLKLI